MLENLKKLNPNIEVFRITDTVFFLFICRKVGKFP